MNSASDPDLNGAVSDFLDSWTDIGRERHLGLLAETIMVGTGTGTALVTRDAFLAVVEARQGKLSGAAAARLADWDATRVGKALVLLTASWSADSIGATLISDFILQPTPGEGLQCVAYLPRQDPTTLISDG